MSVRLIQIGLEVLDRGRHDVDPIVRDVTPRRAFEAADQGIVKQIFIGMQPHQNSDIPDESSRHSSQRNKSEACVLLLQRRKGKACTPMPASAATGGTTNRKCRIRYPKGHGR